MDGRGSRKEAKGEWEDRREEKMWLVCKINRKKLIIKKFKDRKNNWLKKRLAVM